MEIIVRSSKKVLDKAGERIWFEKPYFDTALRRTFQSIDEKKEFMDKHGIVNNGDSDAKVADERRKHAEEKGKKEWR